MTRSIPKKLHVEKAMRLALRFNDPEFAEFARNIMIQDYGGDAIDAITWHEDDRRAFNLLKDAGTQVFVFDPDLQKEVEYTEGDMTKDEVKKFFPFDAAYIKIANPYLDGFIVLKSPDLGFWPVGNPDYMNANRGGESGFMVDLTEVIPYGVMCNLTAYIAAANADINCVYTPTESLPANQQRKRSQATIHHVGYRIGAQLREYKHYASTNQYGGTVRPHMRRAHWHRFWVGKKGSQKLMTKWLAPIFVNPNGEAIDGITLREVV